MKNYLTMGGGLLTAIFPFLAFVSLGGLSVTCIEANGNVGYFWVAVGVVMAVCGFMGSKVMNIVGLILSLVVAGMAIKYKMDAGAATGIGIWLMMAGGALGVIGCAMALMKKSA